MKPNKGPDTEKYLTDLVAAGLAGDSGKVELAALSLARSLKKDYPDVSKKINTAVSSFALSGNGVLRSSGSSPLPVDSDSQLDMATVINPDNERYISPVLSPTTNARIQSFLDERASINLFLERGIMPSTSILLIGQPGTGKTMLARYIATSLNKNLVILDLSTSISSLMGKTGVNLKKVLNYAKQNASVLLFDEFDAIAKKRDDNTDLGEIKRVVNVLLMELEDWPVSSVFIATSNHPELLDKAIWRRFDHIIEIDLPESQQRLQILQREFKDFSIDSSISDSMLLTLSKLLDGKSAADMCKFANRAKRRSILKSESITNACLHELDLKLADKKSRGNFCVVLKEELGDSITVREIADITGLSSTGVQYHLSKENHE